MNTVTDPTVIAYLHNNCQEKRKGISMHLVSSYPDRIPVIVGRGELKLTPPLQQHKFLPSADATFGKFCLEVRKRILNVEPHISIFFFVNNFVPPHSISMKHIYEKYSSEDGFLYVTYACENTFG